MQEMLGQQWEIRIDSGGSKKVVQRGRRRKRTEGVPLGYVEDSFEPRTKLEAFFSRLISFPGASRHPAA